MVHCLGIVNRIKMKIMEEQAQSYQSRKSNRPSLPKLKSFGTRNSNVIGKVFLGKWVCEVLKVRAYCATPSVDNFP